MNITPLEEQAHGIDGVVATLQDVSGELALDARARRAERMDAIRRLALGAAHDFNNVLTAIVGTAELGLVEHPDSPARSQFEVILSSALAAAELTNRLQSIGSLKPIAPVPLRLSELAAAAQAAAEKTGETRAIRDTLPPELDLRVAADGAALEVVIAALLRNAREAAGADGRVSLLTKLVDVESGDHLAGRYVEVAVTDSGPGIPVEVLDRIFEPYFSTRPGRPGLGLSEALSVVTRLGGHFDVDVESGTRIAFRLPTQKAEDSPKPAPRRRIEDLPRGEETVLVVEDEEEVELLLRMVLERQGYTVYTAPCVADAEAQLAEVESLDLLLTDVHLPDGTGPRAGPAAAEVPADPAGAVHLWHGQRLAGHRARRQRPHALHRQALHGALHRGQRARGPGRVSPEELVAAVAESCEDERILAAMERVWRSDFLAETEEDLAFEDVALAMPGGQLSPQPSVLAALLELADLQPTERILEVGCGTGYVLALCEALGAEVFGVELDADLATIAAGHFPDRIRRGDGREGWVDNAPFDAILAGAGVSEIPAAWLDQLSPQWTHRRSPRGSAPTPDPVGARWRARARPAGGLRRPAPLTGVGSMSTRARGSELWPRSSVVPSSLAAYRSPLAARRSTVRPLIEERTA